MRVLVDKDKVITTAVYIVNNLEEMLNTLSRNRGGIKALKSTFQKWKSQYLRLKKKNALDERNSKLAIMEEEIHEPDVIARNIV